MSVRLSGCHTFLVVMHSYVSQATHTFLGMLPLCFNTKTTKTTCVFVCRSLHLYVYLSVSWSVFLCVLQYIGLRCFVIKSLINCNETFYFLLVGRKCLIRAETLAENLLDKMHNSFIYCYPSMFLELRCKIFISVVLFIRYLCLFVHWLLHFLSFHLSCLSFH